MLQDGGQYAFRPLSFAALGCGKWTSSAGKEELVCKKQKFIENLLKQSAQNGFSPKFFYIRDKTAYSKTFMVSVCSFYVCQRYKEKTAAHMRLSEIAMRRRNFRTLMGVSQAGWAWIYILNRTEYRVLSEYQYANIAGFRNRSAVLLLSYGGQKRFFYFKPRFSAWFLHSLTSFPWQRWEDKHW